MAANEFPMTSFGKKQLESELDRLVKVEREAIKKAISEARELGDLKENAEYHAAKEKQSHIEGRIMEIQAKLGSCREVNVSELNEDKVVFGATVTLFDTEKETSLTFQIVGEDEAKDSNDGSKKSFLSPICKVLIGKEEGDEVVVKAPKGDLHYEIENVEYK